MCRARHNCHRYSSFLNGIIAQPDAHSSNTRKRCTALRPQLEQASMSNLIRLWRRHSAHHHRSWPAKLADGGADRRPGWAITATLKWSSSDRIVHRDSGLQHWVAGPLGRGGRLLFATDSSGNSEAGPQERGKRQIEEEMYENITLALILRNLRAPARSPVTRVPSPARERKTRRRSAPRRAPSRRSRPDRAAARPGCRAI